MHLYICIHIQICMYMKLCINIYVHAYIHDAGDFVKDIAAATGNTSFVNPEEQGFQLVC